jgi:L-cysteate sulfo-lyase
VAIHMLDSFHRFQLLSGPTPIERLTRLEQSLGDALGGARLFVKRDDLMSVGGGGNKLRKLEFLVGAALANGCDTFLTTGGLQSNHARLSAAACARAGLACEVVLTRVVPRDDIEYRRNGNVLLNSLFGATVHELPGDVDALEFAQQRARELRTLGRNPYVVGSGGSSPIGALGYVACALEIGEQEAEFGPFSDVVLPNGSSGTHAGLAAGFAALGRDSLRLESFAVLADAAATHARTYDIAREALTMIGGVADLDRTGIIVNGQQLGEGYGRPTEAMFEAVRLVAKTEGLILDPVYGGKAFAGLLAAVRSGAYGAGASVLFVMTGGLPGVFAYRPAFDDKS